MATLPEPQIDRLSALVKEALDVAREGDDCETALALALVLETIRRSKSDGVGMELSEPPKIVN